MVEDIEFALLNVFQKQNFLNKKVINNNTTLQQQCNT